VAINDDDLERLRRCVELARVALGDGDEPFGSILVDGDGATLYEDRNRVKGGDHTRHPEFAIARWAVDNLTPDERARSSNRRISSSACRLRAGTSGAASVPRT